MNPRLLLALALVLGEMTLASGGIMEPQPLPSLCVVIIPSATDVRVREPFGLQLCVENPAQTNQTIWVMNCSWDEAWQSSNTNVSWMTWDCSANFAVEVTIPPGGAYTNELQMYIYNLIPDKELSFCMGFTSGKMKTLWSNEVKLHILPPEAWQHGGKYYRDRNHDGKIDWEVSGRTWMGHVVDPLKYSYVTNSDGSVYATQEITGQGVGIYKSDTNCDGFYDLEYGVSGTNGQIQWTKNIHERVPVVGKDFVPVEKESWMDSWVK